MPCFLHFYTIKFSKMLEKYIVYPELSAIIEYDNLLASADEILFAESMERRKNGKEIIQQRLHYPGRPSG